MLRWAVSSVGVELAQAVDQGGEGLVTRGVVEEEPALPGQERDGIAVDLHGRACSEFLTRVLCVQSSGVICDGWSGASVRMPGVGRRMQIRDGVRRSAFREKTMVG